MPYITQETRDDLGGVTGAIYSCPPENAGELQYLIARMIDYYLDNIEGGARYQDMNNVMGALSGASMEFYRCVVAPYEDEKIKENGSIYGDYTKGDKY